MKVRITFPNRATETWEVDENRCGGSPDLICSRDGVRMAITFDTSLSRVFFAKNKEAHAAANIDGKWVSCIVKALGAKK